MHVYRLHTSRGVIGPVKIETVRDLADSGLLQADTLVSRDDGPPVALSAIPELASMAKAGGANEDQPVYAGDIAVTSFMRILLRLYSMNLSGVIVVKDATRRKDVHLEHGDPVFVSSTIGKERLGEFLIAQGRLTAEQLRVALVKAQEERGPLGEALVHLDMLPRRAMEAALREQQISRLNDLCAWEHGRYSFFDRPRYEGAHIDLRLTTPELWVHAARALPERVILRRLGDMLHQVVVGFDHDVMKTCNGQLSAEERLALGAFDGERSAVQVITAESVDGNSVRRRAALTVLYLLWEIGGIRLRSAVKPLGTRLESAAAKLDHDRK